MAGKVLVNLATGLEDAERVTVAFLVATAAVEQGKLVVVWATKADDAGDEVVVARRLAQRLIAAQSAPTKKSGFNNPSSETRNSTG